MNTDQGSPEQQLTRTVQIRCVSRTDRPDAPERISRIGADLSDGSTWSLTVEEAIARVEDGRVRFYTQVHGRFAWVVVATLGGRSYLKAEIDGEQPTSLLALPECPSGVQ
jgi:hypothetical protein